MEAEATTSLDILELLKVGRVGSRPVGTREWKAALENWLPPIYHVFPTTRWADPVWRRPALRVLAGYGLGGTLVRLLQARGMEDARAAVTRGDWKQVGGMLLERSVKAQNDREYGVWVGALLEALLFAARGWRGQHCPRDEGHWFIAAPRTRVACHAHRRAVWQARWRGSPARRGRAALEGARRARHGAERGAAPNSTSSRG